MYQPYRVKLAHWILVPVLLLGCVLSHCSETLASDPTEEQGHAARELASNENCRSILASAAAEQDWERVGELLSDGVAVEDSLADGTTALHWAAHYEAPDVVRLLLKSGAPSDATNHYGVRPLSLACTTGNSHSIRHLLAAGADPNRISASEDAPLTIACRTGRTKPVQLLLKFGAEVDAAGPNGQTPIMWAAVEGHVDVVKELIRAGADFRRSLDSGFTPLMFAVREGQVEVVQALLEAGADVQYAMQPKRSGGKRPRRGMSPLLMAVENGHYELGVMLLKAGADPNDQRTGFTPLHNLTWVRKPNRGDGADGDPAPMGSGTITSLQFVRHLVKHGADVNCQLKKGRVGRGRVNHQGATPFLFAAKRGDLPLMRLLLELGADPLLPNADGTTPLMVAAGLGTLAPGEEAGSEEEALAAVELLLSLGADINDVDQNGETAMHGAAYKSFPRVVNLLAERGAEVAIWNRENRYGWTPILIAEGHRPGNFKPAPATLRALHDQLRSNGIDPPPPTPREKRIGYDQR